MAREQDSTDLAVADLHEWLDLGLERAQHLLTAGECAVVRRMRALSGEAARCWALLSARRGIVFRRERLTVAGVANLDDALEELRNAGLVSGLASAAEVLAAATREELSLGCKRLGLPRSGRRNALEERLAAHPGWSVAPHIRVHHRALLQRLGRFATLSRWPDRSAGVLERLGLAAWPDYVPTGGRAFFGTRRALVHWEAVLAAVGEASAADLLGWMTALPTAPAGLSLRGSLRRRALEVAREHERAGAFDQALTLYEGLVTSGLAGGDFVAVRAARCRELAGDRRGALAGLLAARDGAALGPRLAMQRPGRRLAKALRTSWPPDRPPLCAPERSVPLARVDDSGARPLWGPGCELIEAAVCTHLAAAGRTALRAENGLWTALFALLMAEHYLANVPGALPVPRLSAPLDLGTPAFRVSRPGVDHTLAAIEAGEAAALVQVAVARWGNTRLAGLSRTGLTGDALVSAAQALPGPALAMVCRELCDRGWRVARGFPDLLLLPGESANLPGAFPSALPPSALLIEVKGPSDTLRDGQRAWIHRLLGLGAAVEVWKVGQC